MRRRIIICISALALTAFLYEVESLPAYDASAQNNKSANAQAAPSQIPPLRGAETSVAGNDASPATDKIRKSEWIAIGINGFIALVIFWQAWIYNEQRKATRIAERGYVEAKTIALMDFKIGVIPYIEVTFLNGGRTPIWNLYTPASFDSKRRTAE